jgi:hypothetical protein
MEKKEARVLNAIPSDKTLIEYFDSLDVFEKRELIDELKYVGNAYSKNLKKQITLASVSWICSFLCYFGVQETWFIYYLIAINVPLTIFFFLNVRGFTNYNGVARFFEKRMSEQ